ncbi:MAG: DoxX family membrane protein [Propionibacteriaceae bacterium]|nr:DoxX family membrane protein [Propionibacteriaceae bacterium]
MITPTSAGPRTWHGWVGLAARVLLGGVLLVAGALKLPALGESINAVMAYRLLPYDLVPIVGTALPLIEVSVGLLLLTGTYTRVAGALGGLLMVAFIIGIASAWARGLALDCGCFGGGGEIPLEEALAAYPWEIARDVGLLACGAWLTVFPRTPFAVDNQRLPDRPADVDDAHASASATRA